MFKFQPVMAEKVSIPASSPKKTKKKSAEAKARKLGANTWFFKFRKLAMTLKLGWKLNLHYYLFLKIITSQFDFYSN